ncbi:Protein GVQW1 [Plecturocebus cupreus]
MGPGEHPQQAGMRFHHVGQASLELLTSGDLPTVASQSAGISHCTWPSPFLKMRHKLRRRHSAAELGCRTVGPGPPPGPPGRVHVPSHCSDLPLKCCPVGSGGQRVLGAGARVTYSLEDRVYASWRGWPEPEGARPSPSVLMRFSGCCVSVGTGDELNVSIEALEPPQPAGVGTTLCTETQTPTRASHPPASPGPLHVAHSCHWCIGLVPSWPSAELGATGVASRLLCCFLPAAIQGIRAALRLAPPWARVEAPRGWARVNANLGR